VITPARRLLAALSVLLLSVVGGDIALVVHRLHATDPKSRLSVEPLPSNVPTVIPTPRLKPSPSATPRPQPTPTPRPVTVKPPPRPSGQIVFILRPSSHRPTPTTGPVTPSASGYDAWIMRSDGSHRRQLTTGGHDAEPALSPDESAVVWTSNESELWVMRVDGSAKHRVARCPVNCQYASWSPDGKRIAYVSWDGHVGDVVVIDASGRNARRYPTSHTSYQATWSPDGKRLVVDEHGPSPGSGLWILSLDTGHDRRIRNGQTYHLDWSPDGTAILFTDGGNLFTVAPDGSHLRQLTASTRGQYLGGSWSPDQRTIVFDFFPGEADVLEEIWTMTAQGTHERQLTDGTDECYEASFHD
jgi:Tol biopolymer transport system component